MSPPLGPAKSEPQLTVRAVLTGMLLGALLAPANIYAGLKVGWAFNMALSAALLSYGFWSASARLWGSRRMNLLENNINQIVASSAAMIASAGLVAGVPALTLATGYQWGWATLASWTFTVSAVGVGAALLTRRQLLVVEKLRFPSGVATATTLLQLYERGQGAVQRLRALLVASALSAGLKLITLLTGLGTLPWRFSLATPAHGALAARGVSRLSLANLTFGLDPSMLMIAVGVLIGLRAGCSLLLGALLAWGVLAPLALARGYVQPGAAQGSWFGVMVEWMLWPGVALMVAAALTSLAGSWRALLPRWLRRAGAAGQAAGAERVPSLGLLAYLFIACAVGLALVMQTWLFHIGLFTALLGMVFTFLLATVAARVTGETDITPIGAMGQLTQLFYGLVAPGNLTANLMAANVTGGAASQCADLMQDLRSGEILQASFRRIAVAQVLGVGVGSLVGSAAYLLLIPDPGAMLLSDEWPAPAVATWKAAAEVFAQGLSAMPQGSATAMFIAALMGVLLTLAERRLPAHYARLVPSPASVGLAMVIPASYSISMFLGALTAALIGRYAPRFADTFLLVLAAGAVMGESLMGAGFSMLNTLRALAGS